MSTTVTKAGPGQRIDIPTAPNLRDLGGYPAAGGRRVRTGQLYRSAELNHLQGEDLAAFAGSGSARCSTCAPKPSARPSLMWYPMAPR